MKHNSLKAKIDAALSESVEALGYRLVNVEILGKSDLTVQLFVEKLSGGSMTLEDCSTVSKHVSAILDVEDMIESAYMLEVSSPGIDKILTTKEDFETYLGFEIKIKVIERIEGRRSYKGQLLKIEDDQLIIRVDNQDHMIALSNIEHAKLILTNDLIEFSRSTTKTEH